MNKLQLIALYYRICECYNTQLQWACQRFSNNTTAPAFSDEELLTLYIYGMISEEKYKVKSIWKYASRYLRSWFPHLPSYQAFNARLNRLSSVFPGLVEYFLLNINGEPSKEVRLMDSLPIMLCSTKRKAKVARELSDKGYCSTKSKHYYGVKLHVVANRVPHTLPLPELVGLTPASTHDLSAVRPILPTLRGNVLVGDKMYADKTLNKALQQHQDTWIYTPVKLVKGQSEAERKRQKAADDLFSRAVSAVRQPIEALFSWLIEKTDIQNASKVRSKAGLLVHVFGKLAAACFLMSLNP